MFQGFNLKINENYFENWFSKGNVLHRGNQSVVHKSLDNYFDSDGIISATKVVESWFPSIKADVFISHSHADSRSAIGMSGWLKEEFGLNAFVDSTVWGYSKKLLRKFDNEYCYDKEKKIYRYDDRNITTAHVNLMLSAALNDMIDNCECVFFLNTPSSVSCKGSIEENATHSPWIFSEISTTRLIKRKWKRSKNVMLRKAEASMEVFAEDMKIKYDLPLDHLHSIVSSTLQNWKASLRDSGLHGPETLDTLYEMFPRFE